MTARTVLVLGLVAGVLALGLSGCGSKVTKQNFDKIKAGMTTDEVVAILGEPTDKATAESPIPGLMGSASSWTWKDGKTTIIVQFLNGKVTTFVSANL